MRDACEAGLPEILERTAAWLALAADYQMQAAEGNAGVILTQLCLERRYESLACLNPTTTSESSGVVTAGQTILAASVTGYTTYQLTVTLGSTAQNLYTIFGDTVTGPMTIPPAFQVAAPFGADVSGTSPAFWEIMPDCQYDSWMTVGVTTGSTGQVSAIGVPFGSWTETTGISTDNGAVFWMDPNISPSDRTIVSRPLSRLHSAQTCRKLFLICDPFAA
eukprot:COSAG02_NODE_147_length_33939_cov_6.689539_8_plen_220_part_00